ncbi:MAG: hypothetical protein FWB75_06365 [Oscillospiraceae bacterium]|nr:hypothetical protein [Oscillospiraceae bacterium]
MEENKTEATPTGPANKPKVREPKTPEKQAFIYLGPILPGGILFKGAIFKDKIPEYLDSYIEKLPEVKKLLVEVKDSPKFIKALKEPGTQEHALYQYVEKERGVLKDV